MVQWIISDFSFSFLALPSDQGGNPSIRYTACLSGAWGNWSQPQLIICKRQGTIWKGCQSIADLAWWQTGVYTYGKFKVASSLNLHVFGLLEKTKLFRGSPHRHKENMQTLHGKTPFSQEVRRPYCYEATVLSTALQFHPGGISLGFICLSRKPQNTKM